MTIKEEILNNNWEEINDIQENTMFRKGNFDMNLSIKNYIIILHSNRKINSIRYYGKFPKDNLKLIEELVCW
jgi:hypothetical protein